MVFFETQSGGAAFSVGSIAYAGSFGHRYFDNPIARLSWNVLRRFVNPEPFVPPPA
jgi:N,N-dimethylformamidase